MKLGWGLRYILKMHCALLIRFEYKKLKYVTFMVIPLHCYMSELRNYSPWDYIMEYVY